jgi:UDP-N-acetylmuramate dehydrogenase
MCNAERIISELKKYGKVSVNTPLAGHTSFKTGGPAAVFAEPFGEKGIAASFAASSSEGFEIFIMGGGTNLLISDNGFPGVVIKISETGFSPEINDEFIYSSSFVSKDTFIESVIDAGYGGVEFMAGIPGSIGGGIFMNAGTFMGCFVDVLFRIRIADSGGNIREIDIDPEDSGYRNMNLPEECVILGGYFKLPGVGNIESVKTCIKSIVDERRVKHPMEYPSAGSVFKNPGGHSAWKLVNDCGLKGYKIGGAMVSDKHTNFIINTGDATSQNIYDLIKYIQNTVYDKTGVNLETEVKIKGNFR